MASTLSSPDSYFQTLSSRDEPAPFPTERATIELVELHDEPVSGIFPSLLSVYQERGYEHGYRQAVADIVAGLFAETEDFVRANSRSGDGLHVESPAELRRLLYRFGEQLERRLQSLAPDAGFVSDGLGI